MGRLSPICRSYILLSLSLLFSGSSRFSGPNIPGLFFLLEYCGAQHENYGVTNMVTLFWLRPGLASGHPITLRSNKLLHFDYRVLIKNELFNTYFSFISNFDTLPNFDFNFMHRRYSYINLMKMSTR